MPDLQYGEVVDIAITGARVTGPVGDDRILFAVGDDAVSMVVPNPQVTIGRAMPADGAPEAGDIWRDQLGTVFAAVFRNDGTRLVEVIATAATWYRPWDEVHKGPTGPIRLLYRLTDDPHYVTPADATTTPEASAPAGPAEAGTPPPAQTPDGAR